MNRFSTGRAAALTLAVLLAGGGQALAQTAPAQGPANNGTTVNDILKRAEAESARRTIGNILGAIAGPANAQTAPPPATVPAVAAAPAQGTARGAGPAPTTPPVAIAGAPAAPAPQAVNGSNGQPGSGTPADPNMIVRVPDANATAPTGQVAAPIEPQGAPSPAQGGVGEVQVTGAPGVVGSEVKVAEPGPAHRIVRPGYRVYARRGGGCAPYRW